MEYRQGLDDLNRCINHFGLPFQTATELRFFHRESKAKFRADKRLTVLERLSPKLNEQVTWDVNKYWLVSCPCFMYVDDEKYLVRVAQSVKSAVFVPYEQPLARRLYILQTGSVFFKGRLLGPNDSWGADDVLLAWQDDRNRKRALTSSCKLSYRRYARTGAAVALCALADFTQALLSFLMLTSCNAPSLSHGRCECQLRQPGSFCRAEE